MVDLFLRQMSSLEKVFLNALPENNNYSNASVLKGEEFSYQIAFWADERVYLKVRAETAAECEISLFEVGNVSSELPAYKDRKDDNYITIEPGLFPDVLSPIENKSEIIAHKFYRSLWVSIKVSEKAPSGDYTIKLIFENENICKTAEFNLHVINAVLPKQKLIFTQWMHTDCIASHYNFEVFSDEYWSMTEKFIKMAVNHGINMMLTPIFTPPLDTVVGGERLTVQLVSVFKNDEKYSFDFSNLKKWIDICKAAGVEYYEMAHLFTQWGAEFTPKIMAVENGELKRIFGWDVRAESDEYKNFTAQLLPQLVSFLKEEKIAGKTVFHISDEPHGQAHMEQYKKAKGVVYEHIKDFKIMDALSEYKLYEEGIVENPIPGSNTIEPFLENKHPDDLWTYYCCSQCVDVSNRFIAMPSARNRIIGFQLYKYDIAGFLHWGYNFYYSQYSKRKINPYLITDADGIFPSGDAFSVYPGCDGPEASLRLKVFYHAIQDMSAFELLEELAGKERVIAIIEENEKITFKAYPKDSEYILNVRERVNREIEKLI